MKRGIDYIGVGVGALILDAQGQIFLSQRGPLAKNERGLWEIPGGGVEFGETLAAALRREMSEEYSIEIEVGELLDVTDHILQNEGQHWVSPTFICRIIAGEPCIVEPGKCSAIGWFAVDEIPAALTQIPLVNLKNFQARFRPRLSPAAQVGDFPQLAMIDRLRAVCAADPHLQAAMLYGSFPLGEADRFSDLDIMLFFDDAHLPAINQTAWAAQISPVSLGYHNEFGSFVVIFDNLVRAEIHFDPASSLPGLEKHKGTVWFPDLDQVILLDRCGALRRHLQALSGPALLHSSPEEAQFLCRSLLNWSLFGLNVLRRGETARALEILHLLEDHLLRMTRMLEGQTKHWVSPTRSLEQELSVPAYNRYKACQARLDQVEVWQAYTAAWGWGLEMSAELAKRFSFEEPAGLAARIGALLNEDL